MAAHRQERTQAMLWLHIGMPKTGTTAVQKFLSHNHGAMQEAGLHYMEAGRKKPSMPRRVNSSHNQIVFDITKGGPNAEFYRDAIKAEYEARPQDTCIISSEMFFSTRHAQLAELFRDIPTEEMRILLYCRRYDDYFEAEYKQFAKNGKIKTSASDHIKTRLAAIEKTPENFNFAGRIARIREAFPGVQICPVIYDRAQLTNGNLIDDLLARTGTTCPEGLSTELNSNPSISRIASEAFGIVTGVVGRQSSRRLRRLISEEPSLHRKNDVLEIEERDFINGHLAETDKDFCDEFFPDTKGLFADRELSEDMKTYRRDTPQDIEDMKDAMSQIFRMALETRPDVLVSNKRPRRNRRSLVKA
jgi:hypothetical protein